MQYVRFGPLCIDPGLKTTGKLKVAAEKAGAHDFHYWSTADQIMMAATFPSGVEEKIFRDEMSADLVLWRLKQK